MAKAAILSLLTILLAACDGAAEDRTRVHEAMLSSDDLALAGERDEGLESIAQTTLGCSRIEASLRQVESLGQGRIRFPGNGVMEIDGRIWASLGPSQRQPMLRIVAAQARCESDGESATDIVRDLQSGAVLQRYTG